METESEHIARDMREGRFPKRSEPQVKKVAEPSPPPHEFSTRAVCDRCGASGPDLDFECRP
jgi:hypothetical protein